MLRFARNDERTLLAMTSAVTARSDSDAAVFVLLRLLRFARNDEEGDCFALLAMTRREIASLRSQ